MDLADWRERINDVDRRILALLNERVGYVLNLAPLKRQQGIPVHEPGREDQIFENLKKQNGGPLGDDAIRRIFEAVIREMRAVQAEQEAAKTQDDASLETRRETQDPVGIREAFPARPPHAD